MNVSSRLRISIRDIVTRFSFDCSSILLRTTSLQIVVDHDPKPLRLQLEARHGSRCNWSYLEKGPDIWRVRLRLLRAEGGVHA